VNAPTTLEAQLPWSREEFEARLRAKGDNYHINHPFNVKMNEGKLTPDQIRGWVFNRDHDGHGDREGGIEAWSRLGDAVGIPREDLWSLKHVVPGVKFAVDAYVNFARQRPWQEAVCSSLTEMFAPKIHKDRLANWPTHYPWVKDEGLAYFRSRVPLAQRDVEHGLQVTLDYFTTRAQQERALEILQFKLDVLWQISDAIEKAYP